MPPAASSSTTSARVGRALGRNVVALAAVSFLNDVSSEMIYPLLPLFLAGTIGASTSAIGAIEGAAESVAALLRLASGWWSDRVRRRKPLVLAGYALAGAARPLVAVAGSAAQVLAVRLTDRVGKGIRSSPRDALIADSVPAELRGRAFGFHRAADHAGAVVGPVVAFALLRWGELPLRSVFWLAAAPALVAFVVLAVAVRETPRAERPVDAGSGEREPVVLSAASADADSAELPDSARNTSLGAGPPPRNHDASDARDEQHQNHASPIVPAPGATPDADGSAPLGAGFRSYIAAVALFTLGNSTDAFLLLRAADLGVSAAAIPLLWAAFHVVKSASSTPGGALSDRVGRRPLIVGGWLLYAAVYAGFGLATDAWHAWALFVAYGLFFGLTEGAERALVADLVPARRRGAAFGWYHLAVGVAALPASLLFGLVWQRAGAPSAFGMGAALALSASVWLLLGGRR